ISANLAVINFLPIPIVDGGLFLFLVYEKLKGRPPSLAFQNAAAIVGIALIATVFLVVTWNDLVRLVG
ncbi:MAG: site-2 protease family protein, partial [Chloroflexi bacterium]|nr:site-2 protease family protein [Chloroflexota bacterium]